MTARRRRSPQRLMQLKKCWNNRNRYGDSRITVTVHLIYGESAVARVKRSETRGDPGLRFSPSGLRAAPKRKLVERSQADLGRPVLFAKIYRFAICPSHLYD